ncbi:Ubiquitin-conjugating enzyme E1 [Giardia muris]|uniref:NEDD8-activating enzyme E1 catalytic subunit n=1 Tax=Giardia muris TaxID=5742 RepID=A0A4Z1TA20_GIAMU|nr:Ubiquitin-conjugating enzyme E1 [Giardia muris]|eukprot:TNJ30067.1 Ubiquitin-conjugating enzyme E1 [Giardia muris]
MRVGIVGLGGTGSELLLAMRSQGLHFKLLIVIDRDIVDIGNVGKQRIYAREDVGSFKADVIRSQLEGLADIVEAYSTDATRPVMAKKLRLCEAVFVTVDNLDTRRRLIPLLALKRELLVIDIGTEGLTSSIRFYGHDYPCFHCTSWMFTTETRPICTPIGIPRSSEDCVLKAKQEFPTGSIHELHVRATTLATEHGFAPMSMNSLQSTLEAVLPTPSYVSRLAAQYALQIWLRSRSTRLPSICHWLLSLYNGLYISTHILSRRQGCECQMHLPTCSDLIQALKEHQDAPDFMLLINQRLIVAPILGIIRQIPPLQGLILVYADDRIHYARWHGLGLE